MPAFPKKWLWVLLALAFLVPLLQPLFPDVVSDYRLFLVSTMIIAAIAVLGLNLLTGFNGQISLGHGAFYAVGAYTAADPDGPSRTCRTRRRCRARPSSASSSATCSACRRSSSRATTWRSPPSRWRSRCRRS